jgi:hypothetical protein
LFFLRSLHDQLENEQDESRQNFLKQEIRRVERDMIRGLQIEREELMRQNQNMQRALDALLAQEGKNKKKK